MTPAAAAAPALALLAALPAPAQILGETSVAAYLERPDGGRALARALYWRPWDSRAWDFEAHERAELGRPLADIRQALEQSLRYDPGDLFALTGLFEVEVNDGRPAAALAALERAEAIAPDHPAVSSKRRWFEVELPAQALAQMEAGDDGAALAALAAAEAFAPTLPAVREARTAMLAEQARRQRDAASELVQRAAEASFPSDGALQVRRHLLSAHLFEALVHLRHERTEPARESLRSAATYADQHRSLVQRTARRQELGEELLRSLLLRIDPTVEMLLGPAPAAAETGPEADPDAD